MSQTLESLIEKEFQEVQKTREDLLAKRAEIDEQLVALDLRIRAAENYRATLQGRFNPTAPKSRKPRESSSGSRAPRGSREALKNQIVALLKQHPEGMVSSQITAAFPDQVKAIPNLLNLMKKDGVLHQEARRGPYSLPE